MVDITISFFVFVLSLHSPVQKGLQEHSCSVRIATERTFNAMRILTSIPTSWSIEKGPPLFAELVKLTIVEPVSFPICFISEGLVGLHQVDLVDS